MLKRNLTSDYINIKENITYPVSERKIFTKQRMGIYFRNKIKKQTNNKSSYKTINK